MSTPRGRLELVFANDNVYLIARAEDNTAIHLASLPRGHNPLLKTDNYHAIGEVPVSYEIPGFKDLTTNALFTVRARTHNVRDIAFSIIVTHLPSKENETEPAMG